MRLGVPDALGITHALVSVTPTLAGFAVLVRRRLGTPGTFQEQRPARGGKGIE
jgi:hypothetical protein